MPRKSSLNVDEVLIEQLARGASQTEAGKAAGVGRKAVYSRLQKPEFRKAIEDFRNSLFDQVIGRLASGIGKSVDRLGYLVDHATPQTAAQVAAAKSYVDLAIKFKELNIQSRLADIEKGLNAIKESQQAGHRSY